MASRAHARRLRSGWSPIRLYCSRDFIRRHQRPAKERCRSCIGWHANWDRDRMRWDEVPTEGKPLTYFGIPIVFDGVM